MRMLSYGLTNIKEFDSQVRVLLYFRISMRCKWQRERGTSTKSKMRSNEVLIYLSHIVES